MDHTTHVDPLKATTVRISDGLDEELARWCQKHKDVIGDLSDADAIYRVITALSESLLYDQGPAHLVLERLRADNVERADGGVLDDGLNDAILSSVDIGRSQSANGEVER